MKKKKTNIVLFSSDRSSVTNIIKHAIEVYPQFNNLIQPNGDIIFDFNFVQKMQFYLVGRGRRDKATIRARFGDFIYDCLLCIDEHKADSWNTAFIWPNTSIKKQIKYFCDLMKWKYEINY